jgi:glycosyltransferase involved in cell wall biosynthesis
MQAAKMEVFERNAFSQADVVTAVSEKDELRAQEWGANSTGVVSNGVDTEAITPCPSGSDVTAKELLFLGSLDWFPNKDAIRYFVEDIFPLVRKLDKEILLNIVGRRPDQALRKIAASTEGVTLTGEVDDVVPFLRKAAAVVVPLRIGGGTRIKIIEAMSAGKVVVSTSIGAEGLDVEDGTHILIADTPETFAAAIVKALGGSVSERISANARRLVEKKYGWKRQAENLERYWETARK